MILIMISMELMVVWFSK